MYSLSENDGLSDNRINCFWQDSRGVMWMGSNYGLNSFDGSIVVQYHHNSRPGSIAGDVVNDIKEDEKQTLWIATGSGLSAFDINTKKISNYYYGNNNEVLNRYYSLAIINNHILLATEEGLEIFDRGSKKFLLVKNPVNESGNNRITKIFIDSKQRIWLCTYNGLWQFSMSNKNFTCYNWPGNDALFDGLVNDILEDHNGQIWFGCWSKGLKKIDPVTKKVESLLHYGGSSTNIISIAEQKRQGGFVLWVNSNLSRIDTAAKTFVPLLQNDNNKNIPGTTWRIYCDRQNLLWISTADGVKIYNPARQYFTTNILSDYAPLTSQGISLFPLQNKFLLGAEGGTALLLFNDSLKQLQNLSKVVSRGAAVMNIQQDSYKNYWLCTSGGLIMLDSALNQKKVFTHKDNDSTSIPKNFINTILLKKNKEIWVMPWRKGIWELDAATGRFSRVTNNKGNLLPDANISKVLEDKNGNCWITDYSGGLFKYTTATGIVENIIPTHRFTNEYITGNTLWTVASSEIFSVDIESGKINTVLLPAGKNKYEYDFIIDHNNCLWIATKSGLLFFSPQTKQFQQYTNSDGLYNNDADITFAKLSNGNIIMAAGTYITSFSSSIAQLNNNIVPLLFTGAVADGSEKNLTDGQVDISFNVKNITLSWALLNYSNAQGNLYYYRLSSVNNNWQFAGNHGTAVFNSLEPGTYTFNFKAATSDSEMSLEKSITLVIHPPFWKTWWFRILAILGLSLLFFRVVRYISQRNLKEKVMQLEKEQAIEKERNRISRDMHDELGSGLTKIAILTEVIKTNQASNEHIEKISETARRLVDNLDEMVWALNPKNDSLDKLAAYIAEYTNQYLDNTGINSIIELPDEIKPLHISEEKRRNIFMVVKEFLNNTVKYSGANTVHVNLQQYSNSFSFLIKDDGKGFNLDDVNDMGNGLKFMHQRIADVGGVAQLSSSAQGTMLKIEFH